MTWLSGEEGARKSIPEEEASCESGYLFLPEEGKSEEMKL